MKKIDRDGREKGTQPVVFSLTSVRMTDHGMGGYQTVQPLLGKERIWPPLNGVIQSEPFASFHSLFESRLVTSRSHHFRSRIFRPFRLQPP